MKATEMNHILIIDDDEFLCQTFLELVARMGCEGTCKDTLRQGLRALLTRSYDIVFLDVQMPDGSGLDVLPKIMEIPDAPEVIIITGHGNINGAELAMSSGVWDYIEKGASIQNIRLSLSRALQYREQKRTKLHRLTLKREAIIGNSRKMQSCLDLAARSLSSSGNVLIAGETGTGKELFARAIHESCPQSDGNFVVVDCAALPDSLVESMLLGHQKGAFTGADSSREGLIAHADGGILFLDEIGELPMPVQKKFLRVLQERRFRPLGGKREVSSHFRLISATNRSLEQMVREGTFREDLFFRIQTIKIELPPLRERLRDIPAIVNSHIRQSYKIQCDDPQDISPDFFEYLMAYHWPGNVRELLNTVDRVLAEAFDEPVLFPRHLPAYIRACFAKQKIRNRQVSCENQVGQLPKMKAYLEKAKAQYMRDLMAESQGSVARACEISGMSRSYLYQLLSKYRIVSHSDLSAEGK